MLTIEGNKHYVLTRVGWFLEKLKSAEDPMEIEGILRALTWIVNGTFERVYELNELGVGPYER